MTARGAVVRVPQELWVRCPVCTLVIRAHSAAAGHTPLADDSDTPLIAYRAVNLHLTYGCVVAAPVDVGAQDAP